MHRLHPSVNVGDVTKISSSLPQEERSPEAHEQEHPFDRQGTPFGRLI